MLRVWSVVNPLLYLLLVPYFLLRMATTSKYRRGLRQRLTLYNRDEWDRLAGGGPFVWIHTVSVGELQAARPLLKQLKQSFPQYRTLVSTVTDTGQSLARSLEEADVSIYLPLDILRLCRRVIRQVKPSLVIILETELWPNFIRACFDQSVPVLLVNARLSDNSFRRYRYVQKLFQPLLVGMNKILTQSERDYDRFMQLGAPAERLAVTGNIKFEAAPDTQDATERIRWRTLFHIDPDEIVLVAGSTFAGEETILVNLVKTLSADNLPLRLVIAPRHIERVESILQELLTLGMPVARRSQLATSTTTMQPNSVVVLDTIGELGRVYSAADIVFIGKTLTERGGQNPIEPAAWKKPIVFGPNMQNFRDVASLFLQAEAAVMVDDERQLIDVCKQLCEDPARRAEYGERAYAVVRSNQGALQRILDHVRTCLPDSNL